VLDIRFKITIDYDAQLPLEMTQKRSLTRGIFLYSDRQQPTHKSHSLHISEWQLSHGKQTVDFSEPTGTNRQKEQFKLDPKSKDIFFIHAV